MTVDFDKSVDILPFDRRGASRPGMCGPATVKGEGAMAVQFVHECLKHT